MTNRILFVCLGNICRSPAAEAVFQKFCDDAGIEVALDSAGTSDWHVGGAPYGPMIRAAAARGYDMSGLRARQVSRADFNDFDLIFAMDEDNLAKLQAVSPANPRARLGLYLQAAGMGAGAVPDPYYTRDFDGALDLIEDAARRLVDQLQ